MIAVHNAVPAVNSVGVTLPFDCFDAMKYALHESMAPSARRSPLMSLTSSDVEVVTITITPANATSDQIASRPADLLAEVAGRDHADEDGLQRADDGGVDDARVLDGGEEQGDVGAERDAAEGRRPHAVQGERKIRGAVSRESATTLNSQNR